MTELHTSQSAEALGKAPLVFVTDASVDAAKVSDVLRAAGYEVVDVPRSMLFSRVLAQLPRIVLLDVDAEGALDEVAKVRGLPGSGAIDFLYFGTATGPVKNADDALANDGSAFFLRPVDVQGLLRRLETLTGGPSPRSSMPPSTPPPSIPASRGSFAAGGRVGLPPRPESRPPSSTPSGTPSSSEGRERSSPPSLPSPGLRPVSGQASSPAGSVADVLEPPRSLTSLGSVSHELQELLAEAERRADLSGADLPLSTPEEELDAVLPGDLLAALDEPLEGEDADDPAEAGRSPTATSPRRETTGARSATTSGGRHATTGAGHRAESTSRTRERRNTSAAGGPELAANDAAGRAGAGLAVSRPAQVPAEPLPPAPPLQASTNAASRPAPAPSRSVGPSPLVSRDVGMTSPAPSPQTERPVVEPSVAGRAVVFGPGDARQFFADAIARRDTGVLVFTEGEVTRRVVLREGDLVASASTKEEESLVRFLGSRGDIPREDVEALASKVFPYGRYAGAALIARGWVAQDQLWTVLRAHAEWMASRVLSMSSGSGRIESDSGDRLGEEPSVFGAAAGAAVFVDLVRRTVAPEEAVERLGGEGSRLVDGPRSELIAECNVSSHEVELLARTRGGRLSDVLARAADPEVASVLYALCLLGVLEVVASIDAHRAPPEMASEDGAHLLDEDAVRARIRARLELVDEGDYFAILGVARTSTNYEIRRAYLDLRRAFEPSRLLTPALADLASDVRKILSVVDEAYEILRDGPRRERYRRAIEARPTP